METSEDWIRFIKDPKNKVSVWIKQGLESALTRDPVVAMNDARTLADVLELRWTEMQKEGKFK